MTELPDGDPWPEPCGGWKDFSDIGDLMTDEEIWAIGFEPMKRGWRPTRSQQNQSESEQESEQVELVKGLREALRRRRYG